MPCLGNREDHCCYVAGDPCKHLEENTVEGRRWACGLRRRFGSWDAALISHEYVNDVEPHFKPLGMNCKDWPDGVGSNAGHCEECGVGN